MAELQQIGDVESAVRHWTRRLSPPRWPEKGAVALRATAQQRTEVVVLGSGTEAVVQESETEAADLESRTEAVDLESRTKAADLESGTEVEDLESGTEVEDFESGTEVVVFGKESKPWKGAWKKSRYCLRQVF